MIQNSSSGFVCQRYCWSCASTNCASLFVVKLSTTLVWNFDWNNTDIVLDRSFSSSAVPACFFFSTFYSAVTSPSRAVTSHWTCWLPSQTWGPATMTSTTALPCRRWFMPPRSEYTWRGSTTLELRAWTWDTDTIPSARSPSAAGKELSLRQDLKVVVFHCGIEVEKSEK